MAEHNNTGDLGEQLAIDFLREKGYQILETNWRFSRAEIDIIAKIQDILIFVEVKTRSYNYFGEPEEFVTPHKEALMFDAANQYMDQVNHDWEIRFDIIGIILKDKDNYSIKHIEDAFYPNDNH